MLAALFAALLGASAAEAEAVRIGSISVVSYNVFSPEEVARGWVYRAADAVRFTTRESTIRRFLLFHEGDAYDPAILAETERNLRALQFVKFASVRAGVPHDGVVDVEVITQDAWTTEPGVSLGRKGGTTTYGFGITEKDLFGTGRQLSFDFDKGTERTTRFLEYRDPYLFGPYWTGDLLYGRNSDGGEERVTIARPFYSIETPWSVAATADDLRQNERLYQFGELSEQFRQRHRELLAEYGIALGETTPERARRLSAGIDWVEDRFEQLSDRPSDVLPDPRKFRYVFLRYSGLSSDFLKLNYVNRDLRYEDFDLGPRIDAFAGVSARALGAPSTSGLVRTAFSDGRRLGPAAFLLAQLGYETRIGYRPRNAIATAVVTFVKRDDASPPRAFVARLLYTRGWDLDRDVQFFADGDSGLRGYRLHAFEGNKLVLANVEERFFSAREILQVVSPGAAVFFDAGEAAPPGTPLQAGQIKKDVGIGLRLGIPRAATNTVVRIDLAYAIDRDARGRHGFLLSFASSQAF